MELEPAKCFRLHITNVESDGRLLKISGQIDQRPSLIIEMIISAARENLENGIGAVPPESIREGVICAAKYKDGKYYRARITNTTDLPYGLVEVVFIDYGNKEIVSLNTIRYLEEYDSLLAELGGLASDYYLSRIIHPSGQWEDHVLSKLQSLLCYVEYPARIEAVTRTLPFISVNFMGTDLSSHLVSKGIGIAIPTAQQEVLLMEYTASVNQPAQHWQPRDVNEAPFYTEHVPFLVNQDFPSNPAFTMRLQQNVILPSNKNVPPPSQISWRLMVNNNKASRNPVDLNTPSRQPQHATWLEHAPAPLPASPKKSTTYKSKLLQVGSTHKVFVSCAEEGPELFAVQLVSDVKNLQNMMDDINRRPHGSLAEPPMIGTVCLGRMPIDKIICRAVVMNLSGSQCKLFFVDFGDTKMVSYYDMFNIPEEYVKPNVFAMRFCLSGVQKLEKGPQFNEEFKRLVNGKILDLRVVAPEGPPLIQYGELYLQKENVLDLLLAKIKNRLQFKWVQLLQLGIKISVLVSCVYSCSNFFVRLFCKNQELKAVMDAVKVHCESSNPPGDLLVGSACCARFPADDNWYRAQIMSKKGNKVTVAYVDYGNVQEVELSDLRTITPDLLELPAQAVKCALKHFENKPVDLKTSKQLEMLAMEKSLIAHVVGVISSNTMLVSLVDVTENPPLDIARSLMQLSSPRSANEGKVTAPVRKDAPELFSSAEGGSFKDDHRRWYGEDFRQSGGSFSNSDNRFENLFVRLHGREDRRVTWGERKESTKKRESRDKNTEFRDTNRSKFTPRDRADRFFDSNSGRRPENRFRSEDSKGRSGRVSPSKSRSSFTQVQYKALPNAIPLETPFLEPALEKGAQHEVSVTWIISPESFYTQILSLQPKFLEMMHRIPELYRGVKSYTGMIPVGASVLARYPADGVLYRATVVAILPLSKFIVRYVDFGNKQLVDSKDIWLMDRQLMELPMMAVHCSLLGVAPKDGEWKANHEIDLCFNAPRYQCVFVECVETQWTVTLENNGASVGDMLVEKELAVISEHKSPVAFEDEPIDLTIIVDQRILCKVTHVESYDKFYVQLDIDKAALVEKAIDNFEAFKLTPIKAENLIDGTHCIVRHEGKIYRAMLQDASNPEAIKVVLPDYGFAITTTLANLMFLPSELSHHYYQSLECTLHNYTEESNTLMTLEEMKQKLTGNKFIIYINLVQKIRIKTTLYEIETGKKVAIFEPDEGACDRVVSLCPRAAYNYNFGSAYISHAENLNELYLQKSTDTVKIAELLKELLKFYEEGTPQPLTSFQADELCAAKSNDGNWYRATIISEDEAGVKVQFVDYGNSETVPKENLKVLHPKFFEPCALALVAGLGLVALHDDALSKLLEWTTDKEVQVTLEIGIDVWLASLHLDDVDLSIKLVNEKLATRKASYYEQQDSDEGHKTEAPAEEPVSLPSGCTQAYISHFDNPGIFWLQMLDVVDKIEAIQAELQANAASYADIENREIGTLCVAKYLVDKQWYRAEILNFVNDITAVRFIDYGYFDVLENRPGLIKVIPDSLKEIERYALESSLNATPTGTGIWSAAASECFTTLVAEKSNPVHALIVREDVITYVDIFVNGHSVTDKLISEGHASKFEEPECEDLPSCFASHINSPSEFWIQLERAAPELQSMKAAMVDAENFPELSEREEGVLCAAKYPEDGAWYRAEVIVDGSEGTEVLFVDYGNAAMANELRSLPDELKAKPALSRKCALQKPRDIKSWSRQSENKFNELAAEGATIFNAQFIATEDISIVELYLEGYSVTEELVGLCERQQELQPAVERPTPVGQPQRSSGKVCYVNSLDQFYVQLDDFSAEIDKIIDRLAGAYEFKSPTELKIGSLCAVFWGKDKKWYRAKILEFGWEAHDVLFIDNGNKAKCTEFRQLPEDLIAIEPVAKCCRLAGIDSSITGVVKDKLVNFAAEAVKFEIELLDTNEPVLVKLFIEGKDFSSIFSSEATNAETSQPENVEQGKCLDANDKSTVLPEKDNSTATLENSNDTIKTPGRDDSKGSVNTDTGYTSDHEKQSPMQEESASPVKADSPKKEAAESPKKKQDPESPKKEEIVTSEITQQEQIVLSESIKEELPETESPKKETSVLSESTKEEQEVEEMLAKLTI